MVEAGSRRAESNLQVLVKARRTDEAFGQHLKTGGFPLKYGSFGFSCKESESLASLGFHPPGSCCGLRLYPDQIHTPRCWESGSEGRPWKAIRSWGWSPHMGINALLRLDGRELCGAAKPPGCS